MVQPLFQRHIVLTRETSRSAPLAASIIQTGGVPVLFPLLQVQPLPDVPLPENMASFALVIFISPTAVRFGLPLLLHRLKDVSIAAVGDGTAAALRQHGIDRVTTPASGSGADALLATLEFDGLRGRQILIVRGHAGRDVLRTTLTRQGVFVTEMICYQRSCPQTSLQPIWVQACDAITLSSSEALHHLVRLADAPGLAKLTQIPLFVIHPRIAKAALDSGWHDVRIVGVGDDHLLAALIDHFAIRHIL